MIPSNSAGTVRMNQVKADGGEDQIFDVSHSELTVEPKPDPDLEMEMEALPMVEPVAVDSASAPTGATGLPSKDAEGEFPSSPNNVH